MHHEKPEFQSIGELATSIDLERFAAIECAYRRGYVHGYARAVDDREANATFAEQCEQVNALQAWRESDGRLFETPPGIARDTA